MSYAKVAVFKLAGLFVVVLFFGREAGHGQTTAPVHRPVRCGACGRMRNEVSKARESHSP